MSKVKNLTIKLQSGTSSTYYASWQFDGTTTKTTTTSTFKAGDLVSIKAGSTYYNGAHIPNWVMGQSWYLIQVKGDRAVLGDNASRTNNICSAINVNSLTGGSGGSSSTTTTTISTETLDHYEAKWYYDTGDGIWFVGSTTNDAELYSTYNAPENALKIKVTVKPVAKTRTVNGQDTPYWTGTAVTAEYSLTYDPPEKPSTPNVVIDGFNLTATLENISDGKADQIKFEVYNGTSLYKTGTVNVVTAMASFTCTLTAGGEYRVRCAAVNTSAGSAVYSQYSDYTSSEKTIPVPPDEITTCKATSETSVYLEWTEVATAETYELEYTTEKRYFDGSDQTTTQSGIEFNHYEKTGLESGDEYFFRVRSINDEGESAWSDIVSVIVGKDPAAPTTWSSTTTAITGEPLTLYWVHNSEDGSSQTYAEVEITIGEAKETYTIKNSEEEDEKDKTSSYAFDTTEYPEGTSILWRVRTAGITKSYGDWSVQRTVDIYAPPTLELSVRDADANVIETITSFPWYIKGLPGPNTQAPISYHLSVIATETYETVDNIGNMKIVNVGDEVYSKYFDTNEALLVEMTPGNIDLQNGIRYNVSCTVSMNSGLNTSAFLPIDVLWTDESYEPDVEIAIDEDSMVAYLRPICYDMDGNVVEDVLLSIYRREFDGTFTKLGSGIDNMKNTVLTDPHPSLDYARYRVVATSKTTGAVSFYDPPGYPVGETAIIIQWDEVWSSFDTTSEDVLAQPLWSGSMLKLPYNVDVSDNNDVDVSLVKYIGRSYPTTYYGTQIGSTATWNVVIPKSDKNTLYALRRLAIWMGDVYVREPSGSGYWANISVSFSQKHRDVTIPVTLDITRVEGGM